MADLSLPGVGPISKKWVVIVAAGSAVTIGYIVIRRRSQANAAVGATSSDTSTADTSASDIDPLTGDIAGSAQDQADLAAMQAGGYEDELGLDGLGDYGGYLAATPAAATIPGAGGFTTNGEWAQQAESDLGGLGIDQTSLSAALGQYLTGQPLTAAAQSLVDQAIAEEGYPPVSGPSGYPPAMKTSATSTTGTGTTTASGTGTTTSAGTGTVPKTYGERAETAIANVQAAGFRAVTSPQRDPAHEYVSTGSTPEGGTRAAKGSTVTIGVKIIK